jgi:hypothetical protein
MALLLVLIVLVFAVAAPVAAFSAGLRLGLERGRAQATAEERRDLLDRMERAELSGQAGLVTELSRLYRGLPPAGGGTA